MTANTPNENSRSLCYSSPEVSEDTTNPPPDTLPPPKKSFLEKLQTLVPLGAALLSGASALLSGFAGYQLSTLNVKFNQSTTMATEIEKSIDNLSSNDEFKGKLELIKLYALTEQTALLDKCLIIHIAVASDKKIYKETVSNIMKDDKVLAKQVKENEQCRSFIEAAKVEAAENVTQQSARAKDSVSDQKSVQTKDPTANTPDTKILSTLTSLSTNSSEDIIDKVLKKLTFLSSDTPKEKVEKWIYAGQIKSDSKVGSDKTINSSEIPSIPTECINDEKKCPTVTIIDKDVNIRDARPQKEKSKITLGAITGVVSKGTKVKILGKEPIQDNDGSKAYWIQISLTN